MFNVDDIVTLSAARGGWQGVISGILTLGKPELYRVESLDYDNRIHGSTTVAGADIVSANRNYPDWQVGDSVTLYRLSGEITQIDHVPVPLIISSPKTYTVHVEQIQNSEITFKRDHIVPRWRLLIENN